MCLSIKVDRPECVLEEGEHCGHEYVIVHNNMGYRCGYVKVEAGHPFHGMHYNNSEHDLERPLTEAEEALNAVGVHGGFTFAAPDKPCDKGGADTGYWFGFDCAHAFDSIDPELIELIEDEASREAMRRTAQIYKESGVMEQGSIKTTDYVRRECMSVCEEFQAAGEKFAT